MSEINQNNNNLFTSISSGLLLPIFLFLAHLNPVQAQQAILTKNSFGPTVWLRVQWRLVKKLSLFEPQWKKQGTFERKNQTSNMVVMTSYLHKVFNH